MADTVTTSQEDIVSGSNIITVRTTLTVKREIIAVNPVVPIPPTATDFTQGKIDINAGGYIDYLRPLAGLNAMNEFTNPNETNCPDPALPPKTMDNDRRTYWSDIQTGPTTFNWSAIDNYIKISIDNGWKYSFGITTVDSDQGGMKYPNYVHTLMQSEATKDYQFGGSWIPNWNSGYFWDEFGKFMKSLVAHLKATNYKGFTLWQAINHVDIRAFGNYGEHHYFGIGDTGSSFTGILINSTYYKMCIDKHRDAVTDKPLIFLYTALQANSRIPTDALAYALQQSNTWGKFGLRGDHYGWKGTHDYDMSNTRVVNGVDFLSETLNRWKYAPVCGEPMNDVASVKDGGAYPYWDLVTELNVLHASQMSNANKAETDSTGTDKTNAQNAFRAANKAMGARLQIDTVHLSGPTLTVNWKNLGNAPIYEEWDVWLIVGTKQIKSSFNPKLNINATMQSVDTLPAGTGTLSILFKDPIGYRKPLPLANTGLLGDGSYQIGAISV